jgi:DNA-binding transcriptional LysR family regulator
LRGSRPGGYLARSNAIIWFRVRMIPSGSISPKASMSRSSPGTAEWLSQVMSNVGHRPDPRQLPSFTGSEPGCSSCRFCTFLSARGSLLHLRGRDFHQNAPLLPSQPFDRAREPQFSARRSGPHLRGYSQGRHTGTGRCRDKRSITGPTQPSELTHHCLVSYFSTLTGKSHPLRRGDESFEINARVMVSVNESTAHRNSLLAGLGISQTFRFAVQAHIENGTLVPILEGWK